MKTAEEIDQEYSELCMKLGDLEIKKGMIEHQKSEIIKKIAALAKEKLSKKDQEQ